MNKIASDSVFSPGTPGVRRQGRKQPVAWHGGMPRENKTRGDPEDAWEVLILGVISSSLPFLADSQGTIRALLVDSPCLREW